MVKNNLLIKIRYLTACNNGILTAIVKREFSKKYVYVSFFS